MVSGIGAYNCWPPCSDSGIDIHKRMASAILGNVQCMLYEYVPDRRYVHELMRRTSGFEQGYEYLINTFLITKKPELARQVNAERGRYRAGLQP